MDAVEFIKEYRRMCRKKLCDNCKIFNTEFGFCGFEGLADSDPELLATLIKEWSQSHPQKTMMQDFFEKFPNAPKTMLGYPYPCAKDLGYPKLDSCSFGIKGGAGSYCRECWSRPLED